MLYFYAREPGSEGCIVTGEGEAPGSDLETLLGHGRPPLKAAVEIGAALADILSVAVEDQTVHGDLKPGLVKVDGSGQVAVEGFGPMRHATRGPEGRPIGPPTDVYGLGLLLHAMLAHSPMDDLPRDADAHDEAVVHQILGMDFGEMENRRWVQDIRSFLAQCMAWDPGERPEALDVANVLAGVVAQCPGPGLQEWASGGEPATLETAVAPPLPPAEEPLSEPTAAEGPLTGGSVKREARTAPSAKGESTAFWSKERIDAMLASEEEKAASPPPSSPRSQAFRPAEDEQRPRLYRPAETLPPPSTVPAPEILPTSAPAPKPSLASAGFQTASGGPPKPAPPRPTPMAAPPLPAAAPPSRPAVPAAAPPVVGWQPRPAPADLGIQGPVAGVETSRAGSRRWVLIGLLVALGVLVVLAIAGGILWSVLGRAPSEPEAPAVAPAPDPLPAAVEEEEEEPLALEPPPPARSAPAAPSRPSEPTPRTSAPSTPRTVSTSRSSTPAPAAPPAAAEEATPVLPAAEPEPAEAITGAPYTASFTVQGKQARIVCGDGQVRDFVGSTRLEFRGIVTCRVEASGARTAVPVRGASTWNCALEGGSLTCTAR